MTHTVLNGLLVVDKPGGITSRQGVDQVQRWFPRGTRLGHTGTLDPLATGVLVLCIGTATRLVEYVQRMDKEYEADLVLGIRSDTDDADGHLVPGCGKLPTAKAVHSSLLEFVGTTQQVPPAFSAAKVTGQRAYDLARRGEEFNLGARAVQIYAIDVLKYARPRLKLRVHCGKGTYIRSLARDLGERLGCGAHVAALRRTRVGPFEAKDAVQLDADAGTARACLLSISSAVIQLPHLAVTAAELTRFAHGQALSLVEVLPRLTGQGPEVAVVNPEGELVAIAAVDAARGLLLPVKVLKGS